jgi:hypothetical protein
MVLMPPTRRDGALDELLRYLRNANKASRDVYIGVHADDAERKSAADDNEAPPNNAVVAASHEFGIGVPERSFLRSTIRGNYGEYRSLFASELRRNLRFAYADAERPYHVVGNKAVADVRAALTRGIEPELSEETLERRRQKGFPGTTPLIETGQLKSSIAYSVGKPGKDADDA